MKFSRLPTPIMLSLQYRKGYQKSSKPDSVRTQQKEKANKNKAGNFLPALNYCCEIMLSLLLRLQLQLQR